MAIAGWWSSLGGLESVTETDSFACQLVGQRDGMEISKGMMEKANTAAAKPRPDCTVLALRRLHSDSDQPVLPHRGCRKRRREMFFISWPGATGVDLQHHVFST
jgi:hypothetical protein